MLTLTQRYPANPDVVANFILALTAEERSRTRHRFETIDGQALYLRLARGTVLRDGDLLCSEEGSLVRVSAKPEPVLTVTASTSLNLLRAAYHLGNRHVPVEIAATHLRISPDPVLWAMLEQLGMEVEEAVLPFQPEMGAYGHHHVH
ncbi:MAG: urease accessory protein UreE [Chroococcidiopsidaceae cyanobacterium CP_BM_RX_35]|nr:urease accessory protein UreE [Chroococcidiopsidaceae cyanobacterium CP_BM_RX_35]